MTMAMYVVSSRLLVALLLLVGIIHAIASDNVGTEQLEIGLDGQLVTVDTAAGGLPKVTPVASPKGTHEENEGAEAEEDSDCKDRDDNCAEWASLGECEALTGNPRFMYPYCPRSCGLCGKGDVQELLARAIELRASNDPNCQDHDPDCNKWESAGECDPLTGNPEFMYRQCTKSCQLCGMGNLDDLIARAILRADPDLSISGWGEEQDIPKEKRTEITALLEEVERYMLEEVNVEEKYESFKKKCQNRHRDCAVMAINGDCEENADFMELQCAPVCKTCHMVDFHYRCPMPDNIPEIDAWKPGDLHKMFERIVADFPHVNVLSQPSTVEEEDGPWVITIDHFLADEECERLIELGHEQGYERSADVGKMNWDGTFEDSINDGRTSTNAWCDEGCRDDPLTKAVLHKIENLTGVPDNSSEFLQLLRYEPGQYYRQHHDYIDIDLERPQGVRILTVFLYLNEPEAGGGTNFPYLGDDDDGGLTVMPKKGRVLLWPSVLDEDPNAADLRTEHEALDVEKGLKYGANAWVHQRDFKTPHNASCA